MKPWYLYYYCLSTKTIFSIPAQTLLLYHTHTNSPLCAHPLCTIPSFSHDSVTQRVNWDISDLVYKFLHLTTSDLLLDELSVALRLHYLQSLLHHLLCLLSVGGFLGEGLQLRQDLCVQSIQHLEEETVTFSHPP